MLAVVVITTTIDIPKIPQEARVIRTRIPQNNDQALEKARNIFWDVLTCIEGHERKDVALTLFVNEQLYDFAVCFALRKWLRTEFRIVVVTQQGHFDFDDFMGEANYIKQVGGKPTQFP